MNERSLLIHFRRCLHGARYIALELLKPFLIIFLQAFVGVYRGPYWGIIELQARWACMVFSNLVEAPSPASMARGISLEQAIRAQRPRPQFPHGNYVELAEDLAKEIGVMPAFDELKKYDPSLYQILYRDPLIPAHYRISGPRSNIKVAKEIINDLHSFLQENAATSP